MLHRTVFTIIFLLIAMTSLSADPGLETPRQRFVRLSAELLAAPNTPDSTATLYELAELAEWVDGASLDTLTRQLLRRENVFFETRLLAGWFVREQALSRADLPAVEEADRRLGTLRRFLVMGPFENEGGAGMAADFGPESGFDPNERFPGMAGEVGWRAFPPLALASGMQSFASVFTPDVHALGYAYARIYSGARREAILLLGAGGEADLWLNGKRIGGWRGERPTRRWQTAWRVTLEKGTNDLLLKLGAGEGDWRFNLQLLDVEARPLDDVAGLRENARSARLAAYPDTPNPWILEESGEAENFPLALERLQARMQATPRLETLAALYRLEHERHAYPVAERHADRWIERALALYPERDVALLLCAECHSDRERRYGCVQKGLTSFPVDPRFLLAEARELMQNGLDLPALKALRGAENHPATAARACLLEADLLQLRDWSQAACQRLSECIARLGPLYPLRLARGEQSERISASARAFDAYFALLAEQPGNMELLAHLADWHIQHHAPQEAKILLRRMLALDPGDDQARLRLADLYEAEGLYEQAEALYLRALDFDPYHAAILERLARLAHARGDNARALDLFARLLRVEPQNKAVKEYIQYLKPGARGFEAPYRQSAMALLAEHPARPETGETDEDLLDLNVYNVHANGLSSRYHQGLWRVYTRAGVERRGEVEIPYSPMSEELSILSARIHKPDGRIVQGVSESERNLSDDFRITYDNRVRVLRFEELEPGDAVELEYRLDDVAGRNLFADYFGMLRLIQSRRPLARWRTVILMPKDKPLYYNHPRLAPEPDIRETATTREYTWRADDVAKVVHEPDQPPLLEIADHLHVSTFSEWSEMGRWYWGLVKDQFAAKAAIREKVAELVADAPDELSRVRRIHEWVVSRTRYVGLEFGVHGFKPYAAGTVFERRFGDCKDKAALLIAMFRAAGIDAWMAVIRTSNLGAIADYPPSLAMFNHAIVYLPTLDLYLDGTAEFAGVGELPWYDRRGQVLLVWDGVARYGRVPPADPADNRFAEKAVIRLHADLSAEYSASADVVGSRAAVFRRHFEEPERRRENIEKLINKEHPGAVLTHAGFEEVREIGRPVKLSYAARLPGYVRREGDGFAVWANFQRLDLIKHLAPLSERHYPVDVPLLQTFRWETEIVLGPFEADELPEPVELDNRFGRFAMQVVRTEKGLLVRTESIYKTNRVSVEQYPRFRDYCRDVTAAFGKEIRLRHVQPTH